MSNAQGHRDATEKPTFSRSGPRIPTLDGWRGVAIILVVATHAQFGLFHMIYGGHEWLLFGRHGVAIFFVLSGYLITTRLLNENRINLKSFYLRRFFRLMPCAWIYLLSLVLLSLIIGQRLIGSDLWSCLLFFRNYFPSVETNHSALTDHFWSLSLEEQFYLVWPPLLVILRKRWAPVFAAAAILACSLYRALNWQFYNRFGFDGRSEVNLDGLLLGCVLAFALRDERILDWLRRNQRWLLPLSVVSIICHMTHYHHLIPLSESMSIGLAIACTSVSPGTLAFRVLEWKNLKFIGVISYSVYVWHEMFVISHTEAVGLLLLPAASIASWALIEKPGIRLGQRIINGSPTKAQLV